MYTGANQIENGAIEMKAITYRTYGGPEVLKVSEVEKPRAGDGEVVVRVRASSVTTADWRLRAAAYPGILAVPGRLLFGITGPRNPIPGMDFAGIVEEVGAGVTRFRKGDRVFGCGRSAHAEYLKIRESGAIAHIPEGLSDAEAAALPFGGLCALVFLRDIAPVRPGMKVLIVGASGGVGSYAVQIAKAFGARVTGISSGRSAALVRELGADRTIDYATEDYRRAGETYDVVFDTVGKTDFAGAKTVLRPGGLFVPLNYGVREMVQALMSRGSKQARLLVAISGESRADLEALRDMVVEGKLRPVIDSRFPFERAADAHAHVEGRHRSGAVILDVAEAA